MTQQRHIAQQIVDLINASPRTPSVDQIAALLSGPRTEAASNRRQRLNAVIAAMEAPITAPDEEVEVDRLDKILSAVSREVWAQPPRTIGDLQDFALIARYWLAAHSGHGPWQRPADHDDWRDRVFAEFIDAVLNFVEPVPDQHTPSLKRWDATLGAFLAVLDVPHNQAAFERGQAAIREASDAIWATPVCSFADLALRAAISVHWNAPSSINDEPYPFSVLQEGPEADIDAYSAANVVAGVIELARLRFDADGRLNSQPEPSKGY